ncbi:MAG: Crp/Fnr family transcriptional regulator [Candidatus Korobacteraceae bacterium]|jgi:CRP/FNR family transcriptional regulator
MVAMLGSDLIESCLTCKSKAMDGFCQLPQAALQALESIKCTTTFPRGSVLFAEGQASRGVFILCKGRVKLSLCSIGGKILIRRIAEAGEVIGLSAATSGKLHEWTAEAIDPCQTNFVRREDLLRLLREHNEIGYRLAEKLSDKYNSAIREIRLLALSRSVGDRLAKLLLKLSTLNGEANRQSPRVEMLTQEEMAQMIGTSRETVTRLLAELKKQKIVEIKGSTLVILNKAALMVFTTARPAIGIWSTVMPAVGAGQYRRAGQST